MTTVRGSIPDFSLANPAYIGARVSFFTVNPTTGLSTGTLATLYTSPTQATTALNPQILDGYGKFQAPVYCDVPVIASVTGANVPSHTTGAIQIRGTYRGDYVAGGTGYFANDFVRDAVQGDIYVVRDDYLSGASLAVDVAALHLGIVIDQSDFNSISGLSLAFGTAANPSLTYIGDTNTGPYHPVAADTWGIACGGVRVAEFGTTGMTYGVPWTNVRLAKTANYTALNADKGATLALGGNAFFTLTLNAASGYDATYGIYVTNEDAGRGKRISPNGLTSFILWPKQTCRIFNQNNVWVVDPPFQRWRMPAAGITFNVDPVLGVATNDGLATGAGGALATIQQAADYAQYHIDNSFATGQTVVIQLANGTYSAGCEIYGAALGTTVSVDIKGNQATPALVAIVVPANTTAFIARDLGIMHLRHMRIACSGAGGAAISSTQFAVVDFNNVEFGSFPTGTHIIAGQQGMVNATGDYAIVGSALAHVAIDDADVGLSSVNVTIGLPLAWGTAFFTITNNGVLSSAATFIGAGVAGTTGKLFQVTGGGRYPNLATYPGSLNGTADYSAPNGGVVGQPFYNFAVDTDSGVYRTGADQVGIACGGTLIFEALTTGVKVTGTETITSSNASALAVGRQGATSPALQVDASTASSATGLKIKAAAAAGGLALSVITSGTNENLTLDAAGSGTITLGGTSTGAITLTRNTTASGNLTVNGDTTLGDASGDAIVMNAKSIRRPNAPAFLACNSATDTNATGDATNLTVEFDTEVYDQGGDFASNTFTAPVDGRYSLKGSVSLASIGAGHTDMILQIVTSNRTYRGIRLNPTVIAVSGTAAFAFSVDADMEAADTATLTCQVSGSTKTVSIAGSASSSPVTYFAGSLIG